MLSQQDSIGDQDLYLTMALTSEDVIGFVLLYVAELLLYIFLRNPTYIEWYNQAFSDLIVATSLSEQSVEALCVSPLIW